MTDPNKVLDELRAGNRRFLDGQSAASPHLSLKKLKAFAEHGQLPKAIVLCCSDSRAPVEMIFDQDIGDLFVVRVAGNIVAPSLVGSIEFAASTFGTRLVVVMGHSQCGAISATLAHIADPNATTSENIHDIVSRIEPQVSAIARTPGLAHAEKMTQAVEANVRASMHAIPASSQLLAQLVREGKIVIVGAVLQLDSGDVRFLEARA
jgi:carbonic anhydrase